MENRFFFAIASDRFIEEILLETQGNLPVGELLVDILKILGWPIEVDGQEVEYQLRTEDKKLAKTDTLQSAGVVNFETIWITPLENQGATPTKPILTRPEKTKTAPLSSTIPFWTLLPVEQPSFIHPDGVVIVLSKPPILIGRQGGEKPVQVDLSQFEKDRLISSRAHAEIILDKGEYCLRAFETRNGTFIGRDELKPGEIRMLKNNDIVQFGAGGVRLIFRKPD